MPARILIVDDDALLRELLTHRLRGSGYQVFVAEHGGMVSAAVSTCQPDLIVLDAVMPVMDGFEVLRQLKSDPARAKTPVIMLTALKREQDILGALKLGAADYLVKPFIPEELVARVRRLLPTDAAEAPDDAPALNR